MPVILSKAVGLPFIQPDHVRAVSNFFIVFVDSRFVICISFKASVVRQTLKLRADHTLDEAHVKHFDEMKLGVT